MSNFIKKILGLIQLINNQFCGLTMNYLQHTKHLQIVWNIEL